MPMAKEPEARFWEKVKIGLGCWLWTAGANPQGYGLFNRATKPSKCVLAHRYAYECLVGPIPDDLCVLHRCDVPRCVRPNHLFLGTRTDNAADKVAKGRATGVKGEDHPKHKLTADQVMDIRRLFETSGTNKSELARRFNVSLRNVRLILSGQIWKHLTPETQS